MRLPSHSDIGVDPKYYFVFHRNTLPTRKQTPTPAIIRLPSGDPGACARDWFRAYRPVIASAPVPMMRQVRHSCGARSCRVSVRDSFVEAGETTTLDIVVMSNMRPTWFRTSPSRGGAATGKRRLQPASGRVRFGFEQTCSAPTMISTDQLGNTFLVK